MRDCCCDIYSLLIMLFHLFATYILISQVYFKIFSTDAKFYYSEYLISHYVNHILLRMKVRVLEKSWKCESLNVYEKMAADHTSATSSVSTRSRRGNVYYV